MGYNAQISDVNNSDYVAGALSVTSSGVEVFVGASALEGREMLRIYNNSSQTVFYGPLGVTILTGEPIEPGSAISIPAGPAIRVFAIVASGSANIRVQEMA